MRARKHRVLFSLIILAIAATGIFLYSKETGKYHRGNHFDLLALVPGEESLHGIEQNRSEILGKWSRIVVLNQSTEIWKTSSEFVIPPNSKPKLFLENHQLAQYDVFEQDTLPGHWTYTGKTIWVSTPAGQNPATGRYTLRYKPKLELLRKTEDLTVIKLSNPIPDPRNISTFQTRHTVFPCSNNRNITIHSNSNTVEYSPELLEDSNLSTGWTYLEPAHFSLLKTAPNNRFPMYTAKEVFTNVRYYNSGLVRWTFTAAGFLAGKELPRLAIWLDNEKIGAIKPKTRDYQPYSLTTFVREGFHTLRVQFVNDYYDKQKQLDRNVLLSDVDLEYLPLILIAASDNSNSSYKIDYCTPDKTEPAVQVADLDGYVRRSLVFPASSKIDFRVRIPEQARFIFGFHALSTKAVNTPVDLKITAKPFFGSERMIFSTSVLSRDDWRDQSIDLSQFSDKFVKLTFETSVTAGSLGERPSLAISNPILFSEHQVPVKPVQHIFVIMADALRADHLGCYGYSRPTSPNIDLFAKESVLFENAVSQATGTLPSTASLFTSVYPSAHKCDYNTSRLPEQFLTLPEIVETNGYRTAGFVQNEFLSPLHGLTDGFRWYRYDRFPAQTEKRMLPVFDWIQNMRQFPKFVFFHMLHPHSPYVPPPDIAKIFNVTHSPLASSNQKLLEVDSKRIMLSKEERDHLITLYDAEIRHVDTIFGDFIQYLKKLNIYEQALIIFLSDHGEAFQEHGRLGHGMTVYQEMIHVPLVIKLPSSYKSRGIRVTENVETMDVMPTILELARIPLPEFLQGTSLMSLIKNDGKQMQNEHIVFSEVLSGNLLSVIKGDFKYIHAYGKQQLYNIKKDPGETQNLSETNPDLLKMFQKEREVFFIKAEEWRKKYVQTEGEHIVLDKDQIEELKALGYIQ